MLTGDIDSSLNARHYHKKTPITDAVNHSYLHSCLTSEMLIGTNGRRAARQVLRTWLQMRREMRVRGVVMRQNAARVFMTGQGLPGPRVRPWPAARCRTSSDLLRTSYAHHNPPITSGKFSTHILCLTDCTKQGALELTILLIFTKCFSRMFFAQSTCYFS